MKTPAVNLRLSFGFILGAALIVGCSSVRTRVNQGPVEATSFSFLTSRAPARLVVNERREAVHAEIQKALAVELSRHGLEQQPRGGDVQVGYLVLVVDNVKTATYPEYFGFGNDADALAEKVHKTRAKSKSRDYFEIGALVIDVVNPSSGKLLYRAHAQIDAQALTPANRNEVIERLVQSALAGLQVAQ